MSDTTPNNARNEPHGGTNPETDATTPAPHTEIDYDSAAPQEPENFTGTGSHSAVRHSPTTMRRPATRSQRSRRNRSRPLLSRRLPNPSLCPLQWSFLPRP